MSENNNVNTNKLNEIVNAKSDFDSSTGILKRSDGFTGAVEANSIKLARNVGLSEKTTSGMRQSLNEWKMLLNPGVSDEAIAAYYGSGYNSYVEANDSVVSKYYDAYEKQEEEAKKSQSTQNTNESRIERLKNTIENGLSSVSNLTKSSSKSAESIETADDYFID